MIRYEAASGTLLPFILAILVKIDRPLYTPNRTSTAKKNVFAKQWDIELVSAKLNMRRVWDFNDSEVASLVAKSDEYLSSLYPPESNHAEPLGADW